VPNLTIASLTFEGHSMPDGRIRVLLHSDAGQQELFVTFPEWSRLSMFDQALDAAELLIGEMKAQRDIAIVESAKLDELHRAEIRRVDGELAKARNELREVKAKQAAFVEAASHG